MVFRLSTSLIRLRYSSLSVREVPGCSLSGIPINLTSGVRGFLSTLQENSRNIAIYLGYRQAWYNCDTLHFLSGRYLAAVSPVYRLTWLRLSVVFFRPSKKTPEILRLIYEIYLPGPFQFFFNQSLYHSTLRSPIITVENRTNINVLPTAVLINP
jgi:hypothetical protein